MSSKTGGSLSTILMSVPLAAIPLMAIFGIPQFTAVVASPENVEHDLVMNTGADLGESRRQSPYPEAVSGLAGDAPEFDPHQYDTESFGNPFEAPASPFNASDPAADQNAIASRSDVGDIDWNLSPGEAGQGGTLPGGHSIVGEQPGFETGEPPSRPGPEMTWRSATRRLQELGIEDYHLERGESFDSFLFACSFEPAGTTNVVMRFEAEADDPLVAVADVLEQIDRWLRRSFAESRQAALRSQ